MLAAVTAVLVAAPAALAQQQPPCGLPGTPECQQEPTPPALALPAPLPADPRGADPNTPNPLVGLDFFVDKAWSPAYDQYRAYVRRGQTYKASLVGKIALAPQFKWFGRWNENDKGGTAGVMRSYIERVNEGQPGSVPQIVTLRHQGKGCNHRYKAGGVREDERTKRWFDAFARGVGDARVVIGFEPDSLGTVDCLARSRRQARLDVLRYGVDVLSKLPNATIYLEAGASDWEPAARTAKQLRYIGISKVRGFMLNVTHYSWTGYNIKHGLDISRQVGGKPFIISTSFNGRGPVHYKRWVNRANNIWCRVNVWCHPLMRGLPGADDQDGSPEGRRVLLHRPARLLGRLVQRGYAAGWLLVRGAGTDVRQVRHRLAPAAAQHRQRPREALPGARAGRRPVPALALDRFAAQGEQQGVADGASRELAPGRAARPLILLARRAAPTPPRG